LMGRVGYLVSAPEHVPVCAPKKAIRAGRKIKAKRFQQNLRCIS
jgi:hypothetical protein